MNTAPARGILWAALLLLGALRAPPAVAQDVAPRPWLGVVMEADAAEVGVRVSRAIRGSPAERAGLR